jgi:hypothetical protein
MRTSLLLGGFAMLLASTGCGAREPTQAPVPPQQAKGGPQRRDRPALATALLPPPPREAVKPSRIIPVRQGAFAEWTYEDYPKPIGYRMGDMMVVARGPAFPEGRDRLKDMPDEITRQIRIRAPGRPDYVHEDDFIVPWAPQRFGYGRLDRQGTRYVLVQTWTWGAHCCGDIELFVLYPGRTKHIKLGYWHHFEVPDVRDYDGDGLLDFIVTDESLNGVFTGFFESRFPPMILNVVDGKVVDVSARRGFRPLFVEAARSFRRECIRSTERSLRNGTCAAYVAAAARAGMFRKAWAEMLATYRRRNEEKDLAGRPVSFEDDRYVEELEGFLRKQGYLA